MPNHQSKQIDELYINDVLKSLSQKNRENLKDLLKGIHKENEQTQTRILYEISTLDDDISFFIITVLLSETELSDSFKQLILDVLLEKGRTNSRFVLPFIEHANINQLKSAVPLFASILLNETDTHTLQKTIGAIGKTGEKSCVNVIADFMFYNHEELKREAVTALGNIGGPSAIKRLAFACQTSKADDYIQTTLDKLQSGLSLEDTIESSVYEQFASKKDTLNQLDDDSDIAQLVMMLTSPSPFDRHLAIDGLIEIGFKAIPAVVENMEESNTDSLINGLDILGSIANETALPPVLKLLNAKHPDSNVRFSVCETLSKLTIRQAPLSLMDGITDPSEQVRIAAASAMNVNPSEILISGLKSKVETGGKRSKKSMITSAIIDSHSDLLFTSLLDSDSFVFLASDYLTGCHDITLDFFSNLLVKRGAKSLAATIRDNVKNKMKEKPLTIYCVDDSTLCLKYYLKLFHSAGHRPFLFEKPEDALNAVRKKKPDLVTTDLNIVEFHGLELVENIRKIYSKSELPIAVVTTQKDFVEVPDSEIRTENARDLIDFVIHKPLELKHLKLLLDQKNP